VLDRALAGLDSVGQRLVNVKYDHKSMQLLLKTKADESACKVESKLFRESAMIITNR